MISVNRARRHIFPLITLLMMLVVTLVAFNQPAFAKEDKVYQAKFLKFTVPEGFSFLDKRQFTDANGTAYVSIFANMNEGDVVSLTSLVSKEKIDDQTAIKVQIAQYIKGVLDELNVKYEMSDVMEQVKETTINKKSVYTLNYAFNKDGLLTLYTFLEDDKLHFFSYLKVHHAKSDRGEAVLNSVMNSM